MGLFKSKSDGDDDNVIPLPLKCPPHIWQPTFDAELEIIGRICTKCGELEGTLS